jgi:uncharacterized membrane protein (UPF0136 family)
MKTISDLIGVIKSRQAEIASSLAAGMAPTWDSYQRLVGQNQGLQEALDILNNLLKEDNEDE